MSSYRLKLDMPNLKAGVVYHYDNNSKYYLAFVQPDNGFGWVDKLPTLLVENSPKIYEKLDEAFHICSKCQEITV